ncbi:hypothetical protein HDV02_002902 [Globomyces sp. JEL0801]|nr:hypothetical protein HDV02_002902 [Globomyces sp. JEL0801]
MPKVQPETNPNHVRKPMNAFMLYRKHIKDKIIKDHNVNKSHEISKLAGEAWAKESTQVREKFQKESQDIFAQHLIDHPGYSFASRKSKVKPTLSNTLHKDEFKRKKLSISQKPQRHSVSPTSISYNPSKQENSVVHRKLSDPSSIRTKPVQLMDATTMMNSMANQFHNAANHQFYHPKFRNDTITTPMYRQVTTPPFYEHHNLPLNTASLQTPEDILKAFPAESWNYKDPSYTSTTNFNHFSNNATISPVQSSPASHSVTPTSDNGLCFDEHSQLNSHALPMSYMPFPTGAYESYPVNYHDTNSVNFITSYSSNQSNNPNVSPNPNVPSKFPH